MFEKYRREHLDSKMLSAIAGSGIFGKSLPARDY
jgi:hypothetical protein